jgi:electron transport complex protein RnfG
MKKDFIAPIAVLVLICVITTGVLAATNSVTEPVITDAANRRADESRAAILPGADSFEKLDLEFPDGVTDAYSASNGAGDVVGYVLTATASGYGGAGSLGIMLAISPEGVVTGITTLANGETKGLGSRVSEPDYEGQFVGMDKSLTDYHAVTGATISSDAYRGAVESALSAYAIIMEAA